MSIISVSRTRLIYSTKSRLFIGQNTDIKSDTPYSTIIVAVQNPIVLEPQVESNMIIEIRNAAGANVIINSTINIDGAVNNQLVMADGSVALLLYINEYNRIEKYKLISGSPVGLTLN